METPELERFRLKVREYRLLVNRNQGGAVSYLKLDYNQLSNLLNGHKTTCQLWFELMLMPGRAYLPAVALPRVNPS
jgi:hypothetical protein